MLPELRKGRAILHHYLSPKYVIFYEKFITKKRNTDLGPCYAYQISNAMVFYILNEVANKFSSSGLSVLFPFWTTMR